MNKLFLCVALVIAFSSCQSNESSDYKYWSHIMNTDPSNEKLNSFSFEEKYKIIEYAYNEIGIRSNYPYEKISLEIENNNAFMSDEFLYGNHQINKLAYYVFAFWGSNLNIPADSKEGLNYVKLSDQIWSFEGEQGDLDYELYILILDKMRNRPSPFSNWKEVYDSESQTFKISFNYFDRSIKWNIENEVGGSINNKIFKLYTDLTQHEYKQEGTYFFVMESGGGITMFLPFSSEEYLRKLWDFKKINRRGTLRSLADYGDM